MGVVAPPAQIRKQRVGDVDRASALGPGRARERVKPFELCDRRGKLPNRAQAAKGKRLRARRRTRQWTERAGVRPPPGARKFGVSERKHLRFWLEQRRQVKAERAKAHAKRLESPALVAAE
jgi:hypothetical protein